MLGPNDLIKIGAVTCVADTDEYRIYENSTCIVVCTKHRGKVVDYVTMMGTYKQWLKHRHDEEEETYQYVCW